MKIRRQFKRGVSLSLAMTMCAGLLQVPAFAGEDAVCGQQEHTHTTECYRYTLICEQEEVTGHAHGHDCYAWTQGDLICEQEEAGGHTHSDACYETEKVLSCGQEEAEGHTHGNGCYTQVQGSLICSDESEEHEHSGSCYESSNELTCTQEESAGHSHSDSCYTVERGALTCEQEETAGHTHGSDCYAWIQGALTCEQEEAEGHTHGDACYEKTLICEQAEHTHTASCYKHDDGSEEPSEEVLTFLNAVQAIRAANDGDGDAEVVLKLIKAARSAYDALGDEERSREDVSQAYAALETIAEISLLDETEMSEAETFVAMVDALPEVTAENCVDMVAQVGNVWAYYTENVSKFYGNEYSIEEKAMIKAAYEKLMTRRQGIVDFYPITGELSETADGTYVLTLDGKGTFNEEFVLVVDGERKDFVGSTNIGSWSQKNLFHLTSDFGTSYNVVFKGDITEIADGIFCWTKENKLAAVDLGNVTKIGSYAFTNCAQITSIDLSKVKSIGAYAFQWAFADDAQIDIVLNDAYVSNNAFQFSMVDTLMFNGNEEGTSTIPEKAFTGCRVKNVTLNNINTIGKGAFSPCTSLETLTLNNVKSVGESAFSCSTYGSVLKTVTLNNVGTIDKYAFLGCIELTSVTLENVSTIGQYAFYQCPELTTINGLEGVDRIDGYAFYGCSKLSGLTVADMTKMGFNGNYAGVMDRVQAILNGQFKLDDSPEIVELDAESGWDSSTVGRSDNWDSYDNGTQLVEQARWKKDTNSTVAEVKVDAYYTAPEQMDFIFVADLSSSMAQLGNANDQNARFYDMQSKLLDVTANLLQSDEDCYDSKVAIVTFGGLFQEKQTAEVMPFTDDAGKAMGYVEGLAPYYESTDYGLGLQEALKLAEANKAAGRNTTVVFLSDGAPTANGSGDMDGTTAAGKINDLGVNIYGVLHSPTSSKKAAAAMDAVCDEYFVSTDTQSFSEAMNLAFSAVYPDYTVTIPVNESFTGVTGLKVSAQGGEASYNAADHTITWTITGMPFTKHTLTYSMTLKSDLASQIGEKTYDVNAGNAAIEGGASTETPQLTRSVAEQTTYYTLTVRYVDGSGNELHTAKVVGSLAAGTEQTEQAISISGYRLVSDASKTVIMDDNKTIEFVYARNSSGGGDGPSTPDRNDDGDDDDDDDDTPVVDLPEEDVPLTDLPEEDVPLTDLPEEDVPLTDLPEEDVPLTDLPEEDVPLMDLPEEDVPLADVPKTGDSSSLWLLLALLSMAGLAGVTALNRRKRESV